MLRRAGKLFERAKEFDGTHLLKEDQKIVYASRKPENHYEGFERCRKNKLPAIGIAVTKK